MSEAQPETDARGIAEDARARVRFEEEGGKVTGMTLIQPNGVFTAKKK